MRELACLGHSNTLASETCQFQSLRRRQRGFEEWVEEVGAERKEKQKMLITECKSHCKPSPIALGTQTRKAAIGPVAMRTLGRRVSAPALVSSICSLPLPRIKDVPRKHKYA